MDIVKSVEGGWAGKQGFQMEQVTTAGEDALHRRGTCGSDGGQGKMDQ